MIGFAPANNPQVAVAVVVPQQANGSDGASVAGPIMNKVLGGGAAVVGQPALHRASRSRPRRFTAAPETGRALTASVPGAG